MRPSLPGGCVKPTAWPEGNSHVEVSPCVDNAAKSNGTQGWTMKGLKTVLGGSPTPSPHLRTPRQRLSERKGQ